MHSHKHTPHPVNENPKNISFLFAALKNQICMYVAFEKCLLKVSLSRSHGGLNVVNQTNHLSQRTHWGQIIGQEKIFIAFDVSFRCGSTSLWRRIFKLLETKTPKSSFMLWKQMVVVVRRLLAFFFAIKAQQKRKSTTLEKSS